MMQTRINVNGKDYSSVDDMPPDVRRQYNETMKLLADRDGNGVPDVFEGKFPPGKNVNVTTVTSSSVMFNGKMLNSAEELPDEVRNLLGSQRSGLSIHLSASTIFAIISLIAFIALLIWVMR